MIFIILISLFLVLIFTYVFYIYYRMEMIDSMVNELYFYRSLDLPPKDLIDLYDDFIRFPNKKVSFLWLRLVFSFRKVDYFLLREIIRSLKD